MSSMKKGLRRVAVVAVTTLVAAPALATVASATSTFAFDRLEGANRYATSVAVGTSFGASTDVILANGGNTHTVDALSAAYLAGFVKAPILLTQLDTTPADVVARITASGATKVWIIGGTGAISTAQETALDAKFGTVTRLGGNDRYLTAEKIMAAAGVAKSTTALLATGTNFPDALGAGPLSYVKGMPVALTGATLPAATLRALKAAGTTKVIALGGTSIVTSGVLAELATNGITLDQRIFGSDRAETSSKLADYMITSQGFLNTKANVASGDPKLFGADALGGAALSGKENVPTLITDSAVVVGPGVTGFLTAHVATLVSGHIFGGTAAVSAAAATAMANSAKGAAATGFIVTAASGSTFTYADTATATEKTATFKATDVFMVDGVTATLGVFTSSLSLGDVVTILPNTPTTGVTTYQLVNKVAADYTSGLIGAYTGTSISIIEPVTGDVLNTITTNTGNTVYSVDGTSASLVGMNAALNPGDTVVVTGTGADATHVRTIAVTSKVLTGSVSNVTGGHFTIDTAAGATLPTGGSITPVNADTLTVDGVAVTTAAAFNADVSNADTVAYSRSAGVQVIALTNKAPLSIHGQIAGVTVTAGEVASFSYIPDGGALESGVAVPSGIVLTVDGALATDAEFADAYTLGDTVVYRAADAATLTTSRLALTNDNFSGTVTDGTGTIHTVVATGTTARIGVFAAGSTTVRLGQVNYVDNDGTKLTGTPVYKVNGVVKDLAGFNTSLTGIVDGSLTGTILVSQTGTTVTYALTTAIA